MERALLSGSFSGLPKAAAELEPLGVIALPPAVSVVIPCYNEEHFIGPCVESLMDDFTASSCEILVVDGSSSDHTCDVVRELQCRHPNIRLLSNPDRLQAHALNLGIRESRGACIVRIDAHSMYPQHYVRRCVDLLAESGADNVGGLMIPRGHDVVSTAIAAAMTDRFCIGNARYRLGGFNGSVDTVYLGTFRRAVFERLGGFDPAAHPNEDGEMNFRIRRSGGRIVLDSSLEVTYRPRDTIVGLARQWLSYGVGRAYTTRKHARLASLRQMAAPAAVASIALALAGSWQWPWLAVIPAAYLTIVCGVSVRHRSVPLSARLWLPMVFVVIQMCWGLGFWLGLVRPDRRHVSRERSDERAPRSELAV